MSLLAKSQPVRSQKALALRTELGDAANRYDALTDIAFDPQKSVNCQAGAAAL